MEVNKDEAERCIQLAEGHIKQKNREKAEKFLHKAEQLYPTQRAKDLLVQIQLMAPAATEQEQQPRKRKVTPKSEGPPQYSNEQLEAVKRIKSCKDHYEVLGTNKGATYSEIRKQYKNLARLLHPDKNKCPGSAEAFKAIGNVVAVLTDPEKRRQYDETRVSRIHHRSAYTSNTRRFDSDATEEEPFNTQNRGGFGNANVFTRRTEQVSRKKLSTWEKFVVSCPTLLAIVLSIVFSLPISDPAYRLQASSTYTVLRRTENLRVTYFVKENFHTEYQGSVRRLEASITEEYLRSACKREKDERDSLIRRGRRPLNMKLPSCEKLKNLRNYGA